MQAPIGAPQSAQTASAVGKASWAWQDRWTATNLLEAAAAKTGSVTDQFNLATTYEQTGRVEEAKVLYRDLVSRGRYTRLTSVSDRAHRTDRDYTFNVAEESASRLKDLAKVDAILAAADGNALAAGDVAVVASTGAPASGRISNEQALQYDAIASAAR